MQFVNGTVGVLGERVILMGTVVAFEGDRNVRGGVGAACEGHSGWR